MAPLHMLPSDQAFPERKNLARRRKKTTSGIYLTQAHQARFSGSIILIAGAGMLKDSISTAQLEPTTHGGTTSLVTPPETRTQGIPSTGPVQGTIVNHHVCSAQL
jgi:hypothetical protein